MPVEEQLEITLHPQAVTAAAGDVVLMHVEANKTDVAYLWRWSTDRNTWKKCTSAGSNTDTFSFLMKETLSGRRYRCVVTLGDTSLISDTAVINNMAASSI